MPQRKKKQAAAKRAAASQKTDDSALKDVLGCLDELDNCVDVATVSETDCLVGIAKADRALMQSAGDVDLQCSILMKRAQLLKTVVEKRYSTDGLDSRHHRPLDSCINDCEKVLSTLKHSESSTQTMYKDAQKLAMEAKKLKREEDPDVRTRTGSVTSSNTHWAPQQFDPEKTVFKDISKINPILLQDIVNCYKKSKFVCKFCFVNYHRQEIISGGGPCRQCKNGTKILVMPASKMCRNFRNTSVLAIPPPPKVLMAPANVHKPFMYCHNPDHTVCYEKSMTKETWYAHSIEELVIWTVERHWGCSFMYYIDNHHTTVEIPRAVPSVRAKEIDDFDSFSDGSTEREFDPTSLKFTRGVASIPPHLLDDVVKCYNEMKEYCKVCFYKRRKKGEIGVGPQNTLVCKICRDRWESVVVIPASTLCWNFGDFELLPIAPWPRSKPNNSPFEYCQKDDHYRCFRVYVESEFWYVHSVEELVIWTVEREKDCTFLQFINKSFKPSIPPPGLNMPSITIPTTQHPPSRKAVTSSQIVPITAASMVQSSAPLSPLGRSPASPTSPSFSQIVSGKLPSSPGQGGGYMMGGGKQQPRTVQPLSPVSNSSLDHCVMSSDGEMSASSTTHSGPFGSIFGGPIPSQAPSLYRDNLRHALTQDTFSSTQGNHGPTQGSYGLTLGNHGPTQGSYGLTQGTYGQNYSQTQGGYDRPPQSGTIPAAKVFNPSSRTVPNGRPNYVVAGEGRNLVGLGFMERIGGGALSAAYDNVHVQPSASTGFVMSRSSELSSAPRGPQNSVVKIPSNGTRFEGLSAEQERRASNSGNGPKKSFEVFKFLTTSFNSFEDIPLHLLVATAMAYLRKQEVCRKCFYGERSLSFSEGATCSDGGHEWINPIIVIPGCKECNNEPCFEAGEHLPIPPLPPVATIKKCSKTNHHKCFQKCLESNPKFAHSVEELVVWIVESEKDCSFIEFIEEELQPYCSPSKSTSSAPQITASSSAQLPGNVIPSSVPEPSSSSVPVSQSTAIPMSGVYSYPSEPHPHPSVSHSGTGVSLTTTTTSDVIHSAPRPPAPLLEPKYSAKTAMYENILDIPPDLLSAVALCFQHHKIVCRTCFFNSGCRMLTGKGAAKSGACEQGHQWRPLIVMPACRLCINFNSNPYVPVLPIPKHMKSATSPFVICKKGDHKQCYYMSKTTNPWFPHTVEELVIWTVERERSRAFESVYEHYLPREDSDITPESAMVQSSTLSPQEAHHNKTVNGNHTHLPVSHSEPLSGLALNQDSVPISMELVHSQREVIQQPISTGVPDFHSSTLASTGMNALNDVHVSNAVDARQSQGGGGASLSLFDDPLLQLGMFESSSSTVSSGDSHSASGVPLSDSTELNVALEYFPALRQSVTQGSGQAQNSSSDSTLQFHGGVPESIGISATSDVLNRHEAEPHNQYLHHSSSHSSLSGRDKQGLLSASMSTGSEPSFDHYMHHSSNSSAVVENWPEISNRRPTRAPLRPNQSANGQGHDSFAPVNSQGSGGFVVETEVPSPSVEGAPHSTHHNENGGGTVPQASMRELSGHGPPSVAGQVSSELQVSVASPRQATLPQENGMSLRNDAPSFSSGMDPNLASNVYITNGSSSEIMIGSEPQPPDEPTPLPTSPPLSGLTTPTSLTISQAQQPRLSRTSTASSSSSGQQLAPFIPYTSLSDQSPLDISPTEHTLRPTAPSFYPQATDTHASSPPIPAEVTVGPFECLFCYLSFMSPEALRKHCRSPAHVELLLQDCCADTVWKHPPPPPPTDEGTYWDICESGWHCRKSRLLCRRPHYADERTEWIRRQQHRVVRQNGDQSLPPFSDQLKGLLISPQEDITQYPSLRVSIAEPLQATLGDASDSFTWTITVEGENWQTLFGIHLKSKAPVFHITDLETANEQSSDNYQSDRANWVVLSPEHAILLGKLSFSVRASPSATGQNYSCEVCLDVGFWQHVYISLALVVKASPDSDSVFLPPTSTAAVPEVMSSHAHAQWHMSDSSGEDLGIEAEDTTLQHEPIDDQIYSLTDALNDEVSSSLDLQSST